MTPEEVGSRLGTLLADAEVTVGRSGGEAYARATVDVPPARWRDAVRAARDDAELTCDFFDWLSAVDELADGFDVVAHLWSTTRRHGVLLRTRIPRSAPTVASVADLFPGAGWHERETYEMFGIDFDGHPGLTPLLLPPEFEGHPLRKEFVLASRVAKAWPGAKEPGESEAGTSRRQAMRPPGVPAPGEWGPAAAVPGTESPPERPARRRPTAGPPGSPSRPPVSGPPGTGPDSPAEPGTTDGTGGA
ncbi:NADH-quinone oxidoreductase subunit C [Plantactinospora sp. CA-290183]|uniref:NADH-quinone oxidoreductase subunit C n=1 Tax=Plantactinospora sp. CA-290183 TaxID=3240006 RepID=UPI003D9415CE